ncbi:hypothetical protein DFH11DRAFT_1603034 [Phellopilus nigrolimitatus]|nr:hypothetical protein DFH11DRAFT_1603034 [Phellopilus nigrolimitatus]
MQVNVEHQFHDEFQEICNKLKKFKKELSSAASEIFNELERGIEVLQTEIKSFGDQIDKALINFDAVHGGVVDPSTQSDLLRQITDKKTATALSSIWGMVDLTWLGTRLGDPGTTVESQNLFSRHLESIEMCYRCLHCALYEFATALDIDKAPASTLEFHKRTTSASHQLEK